MDDQVKDFYNQNYKRFDTSRYSVWLEVKKFFEKIPTEIKVLDAGCGNGKNMIYLQDKGISVKGIDFSEKLLQICRNKKLDVEEADIRNLPYNDNSFDYVISIAVIHHLSKESDRHKAINEMLRVCKPGGKILFSTWALEQPCTSRFNFVLGDNFVKWEDTKRYYYIYDKQNINSFLKDYSVESLVLDQGNYFIKLIKVSE